MLSSFSANAGGRPTRWPAGNLTASSYRNTAAAKGESSRSLSITAAAAPGYWLPQIWKTKYDGATAANAEGNRQIPLGSHRHVGMPKSYSDGPAAP